MGPARPRCLRSLQGDCNRASFRGDLRATGQWGLSELMRLAVVASHPVQYQAPLFRELASRIELHVYFAHRANAEDQAAAGFDVPFEWDVDLLTGYAHSFLQNVASRPGLQQFAGCDTPSISVELRQRRPDVLLVMGWGLKCFWQAIWAAKRIGVPVMVRGDSHLGTPRSASKRAAKTVSYPLLLRVFDIALYVGERSRSYWEHYGYPTTRLIFSPHCIDNDWFARRATAAARAELRAANGISSDAKVVVFAGKLLAPKRPLDLIAASGLLKSQGLELTILVAGAGPLAEEMAVSARSAGVRTVQLGFRNQTEMPAAYAAADMLALTSDSETWGLVANEALACGVPIVISDACGCASDLAADKTAGCIFSVGNIHALAAALKDVIETPPSCNAIAAKAACYTLSAAADGVLSGMDVALAQK